jgi:hypothetical protein
MSPEVGLSSAAPLLDASSIQVQKRCRGTAYITKNGGETKRIMRATIGFSFTYLYDAGLVPAKR